MFVLARRPGSCGGIAASIIGLRWPMETATHEYDESTCSQIASRSQSTARCCRAKGAIAIWISISPLNDCHLDV